MNQSINYEGVCKTAPATPGLLNTKPSQGKFPNNKPTPQNIQQKHHQNKLQNNTQHESVNFRIQ